MQSMLPASMASCLQCSCSLKAVLPEVIFETSSLHIALQVAPTALQGCPGT